MGRSDWRDAYKFEQLVREAREAGRMGGVFDAGLPIVVGHSFGGEPRWVWRAISATSSPAR